jgi:hypothetical protein
VKRDPQLPAIQAAPDEALPVGRHGRRVVRPARQADHGPAAQAEDLHGVREEHPVGAGGAGVARLAEAVEPPAPDGAVLVGGEGVEVARGDVRDVADVDGVGDGGVGGEAAEEAAAELVLLAAAPGPDGAVCVEGEGEGVVGAACDLGDAGGVGVDWVG